MDQLARWAHSEFVKHYELYLDAVYGRTETASTASGRVTLAQALGQRLANRGVTTILDCAAGTGFPGLDLASAEQHNFRVHCCDGDRLMVAQLVHQARRRGIAVDPLKPPRKPSAPSAPGLSALVVRWDDLSQLAEEYDAVMCRGNSLAYADTWEGARQTAAGPVLTAYLGDIIGRVKPGGRLVVDGPWDLDMTSTERLPFIEEVQLEGSRRRWSVRYRTRHGEHRAVSRYSSLVSIRQIADMLAELGFEDTDPFQLDGERASFGTVIARKPT